MESPSCLELREHLQQLQQQIDQQKQLLAHLDRQVKQLKRMHQDPPTPPPPPRQVAGEQLIRYQLEGDRPAPRGGGGARPRRRFCKQRPELRARARATLEQGLAKRARSATIPNSPSKDGGGLPIGGGSRRISTAPRASKQPEPMAAVPAPVSIALVDTMVWQRLTGAYMYPADIANSVFTWLSLCFGEEKALELFQSEWLRDCTDRWVDFGAVIRREEANHQNVNLLEAVHREYLELKWALVRCVTENSKLTFNLAQSDEAHLEVLRGRGFRRGQADANDNNCLIDCLLQLLRIHNLLGVDTDHRRTCQAVRNHLCSTADTCPRTANGMMDLTACLEHARHAARIVALLLRDRRLEEDSLDLVVHARYDTPASPPDRLRVFGGDGTRSPGSIVLNIFNWTGDGTTGYHYDPLFPEESEGLAQSPPIGNQQ